LPKKLTDKYILQNKNLPKIIKVDDKTHAASSISMDSYTSLVLADDGLLELVSFQVKSFQVKFNRVPSSDK
jgi:hypothetical protein